MKRVLIRSLVAMALLGAGASMASAQSLAGTVRDTSGGVLPGVTIEASSPALITKVRTGVTDETGQYRIPDLPPGTYKVSFTLPSFATVVREGVELAGAGVMTISAEMRVGSVSESVTVTGESPVVDIQTARQQTVINGDVVRALPASRSYGNYIAALPAIQATGFGGGAATINNFFSARGGRNTEGLIQLDGMNVGAPGNGGGVSGYLYDMGNSTEVQVAISGGWRGRRGGPASTSSRGPAATSSAALDLLAMPAGAIEQHRRPLRALGLATSRRWDQELRRQPRRGRTNSPRSPVVHANTRDRHLPEQQNLRQPERREPKCMDVGAQ
jgi:hypothetical protein